MGEVVEIYGSKIRLPDLPENDKILYFNNPRKEQKWVKDSLPDFYSKVEYDKEGTPLLTKQQEDYADEELKKCREGVFAKIGGRIRYFTGRYYFYLRYYIMEDGSDPDFREADRLYFIYLEHWEAIQWCLGMCRTKKRRQGASSQACSNLLYEAIFFKNSNCGLLSKTKDDSQDTFTQMVTFPYRQLPVYLKPKQVNKEDTVSKLIFAHKSQAQKEGVAAAIKSEEGNNSTINFKAPVLNAYDRGRMSRILGDEFGKLAKEVPASKLLGIISKTLIKGVKRVGWIDMPSTVNEMTKGGGDEFKKIWDHANQFKKTPTTNRIVRFFQPAYDAYEGFIDEFGDSVIDTPTDEQYAFLVEKWVRYNDDGVQVSELSEEDIKLGARHYVKVKRRDGLSGEDLEEEIRMNPCDEEEAFMHAGMGCEFIAANIRKQQKMLEEEPVFLRQCRLERRKVEYVDQYGKLQNKTEVYFMDDAKGGWFLHEEPMQKNKYDDRGSYWEPLNKQYYQIGVDTTKDDFAVNGSKPTICVFKKSHIVSGEELGMKPVAYYLDKTRLDVHFDDEVAKACLWYGCSANYELDARTDYYRYFYKIQMDRFLEWTPKFARDPVKLNFKAKPGTQSGDPFQLQAQLQAAKMYVDGTNPDEYAGHVHRIVFPTVLKQLLEYDHSNRTKSDQVIALMMALLPVLGEMQAPERKQINPSSILPTFKIRMN